jgi:hypothetical protein
MAVHRWMRRRCGRVVVRTLPRTSSSVVRTSLLPSQGFFRPGVVLLGNGSGCFSYFIDLSSLQG